MSYAVGSSEVSNLSVDKNVLPKNYNAANNNSAMQNSDNLSSGSTMQDPNNASAGNSSTTNPSVLVNKINQKKGMLEYYSRNMQECQYKFAYIDHERAQNIQNNQWDQAKADKYDLDVKELNTEMRDWVTNYSLDKKLVDKWETELRNGGHSMAESSSQASGTKHTTDNSSMSDDYSTSSTKRERNN